METAFHKSPSCGRRNPLRAERRSHADHESPFLSKLEHVCIDRCVKWERKTPFDIDRAITKCSNLTLLAISYIALLASMQEVLMKGIVIQVDIQLGRGLPSCKHSFEGSKNM